MKRRRSGAPAGYDYVERRGCVSILSDGVSTVTLTEPVGFLSMLRAGVLVGQAKVDAEVLLAEPSRCQECCGLGVFVDRIPVRCSRCGGLGVV